MNSDMTKRHEQRLPQLTRLIEQAHAGSARAEDELFQHVRERLQALVRKMLHQNPRVARWQQTGDLCGQLWLKLHTILRAEPIKDRRHFFRLANLAMRRLLCDLARSYRGPQTFEGRHQTGAAGADGVGEPKGETAEGAAQPFGPPPPGPPTAAILKEEHLRIHELLERLDEDEVELLGLIYFQELSQVEAAELLGVDERTVRRRLGRIMLHLRELDRPSTWPQVQGDARASQGTKGNVAAEPAKGQSEGST